MANSPYPNHFNYYKSKHVPYFDNRDFLFKINHYYRNECAPDDFGFLKINIEKF